MRQTSELALYSNDEGLWYVELWVRVYGDMVFSVSFGHYPDEGMGLLSVAAMEFDPGEPFVFRLLSVKVIKLMFGLTLYHRDNNGD